MPIKGENIYKRKDQRWEGRYIREYRSDGSIHYGYCYAKTYREVKQKLAEVRNNWHLQEMSNDATPQLALSGLCDEWLQLCRIRVKESTFAKYSGFLERYIKPRLGSYPVSEISSVMIEQFSHQLLNQDRLSPKTTRDILTVLHAALEYAAQQLPDVPAIKLVYPQNPRKEMRVLSREEQQKFVSYLLQSNDLSTFGILLTLMTGMRIGEICALRWKDVSIEDRTIRIRATMQRIKDLDPKSTKKTKIVVTPPKSNCGFRIVPLTEQAASLCERFHCSDPEAFVLTGSRDFYLEPRTLQYRFDKCVSACGLDGVHFHTLRHTFATRCVEVDFEIKTLSEIMGHASPRITLERYVHTSMQLKRENMNKLAAVGL